MGDLLPCRGDHHGRDSHDLIDGCSIHDSRPWQAVYNHVPDDGILVNNVSTDSYPGLIFHNTIDLAAGDAIYVQERDVLQRKNAPAPIEAIRMPLHATRLTWGVAGHGMRRGAPVEQLEATDQRSLTWRHG
jgi:hypothetical protein